MSPRNRIIELLEGNASGTVTLKWHFLFFFGFLFLTINVIYVHCIKFQKLRQEPRGKFILSIIMPPRCNHSWLLIFLFFSYVLFPLESSFLFLNSQILHSGYIPQVLIEWIILHWRIFYQFIAPLTRMKFSVENTTV